MHTKGLPVYDIAHFHYPSKEKDFYVSKAGEHLRKFQFVLRPHKHDHFLTVLFAQGSGTHTIDFISYPIKEGAIFMVAPGQTHWMTLSPDADGYVLLHTKDFYDLNYANKKVKDYPFFCSNINSSQILLQNKDLSKIVSIFEDLLTENKNENLMKNQVLCSLVDLLYIYLSRVYIPKKKSDPRRQKYLAQLLKLETAIDFNFKQEKAASAYATMLGVSIKHLNRVCNICLGKTTTELILSRVMLEAKRMLSFGTFSVEKVSIELGYFDISYFIRLFKKNVGMTPLLFMNTYRK